MIPLLAASSAISAIGEVGSSALEAWKQLTSSHQASPKGDAGSSSDSFGALLSAHGVGNSSAGGAPSAQAVR